MIIFVCHWCNNVIFLKKKYFSCENEYTKSTSFIQHITKLPKWLFYFYFVINAAGFHWFWLCRLLDCLTSNPHLTCLWCTVVCGLFPPPQVSPRPVSWQVWIAGGLGRSERKKTRGMWLCSSCTCLSQLCCDSFNWWSPFCGPRCVGWPMCWGVLCQLDIS